MHKQIRTAVILAAVLGGAAFLGGKPAWAQVGSPIPIRLKLGVLLPQDGDTKRAVGDSLFGAEIDFTIPVPGATGRTVLSAGYFERSKSGGKFRVVPLTVSQVFSPPNPAAALTGNVYYGLGLGMYLLRASSGGVSDEATRFGGFVVAGYQFPNAYFVEGKYHVAGDVAGLSPNGITVMLGRRL